jgi:hypothetical protein
MIDEKGMHQDREDAAERHTKWCLPDGSKKTFGVWPAALTSLHRLGILLALWLAWLLSIPISWLLVWLSTFLLSAPRRVWCKRHPGAGG